jgi:hypothetical protein
MSFRPIHRETDPRICGHTTIVKGQSTVYANNLLVSVDRDPNSGGGGSLFARNNNVYVNNRLVVNHSPEPAAPDSSCPLPPHCNPVTAQGSPDVFVGD